MTSSDDAGGFDAYWGATLRDLATYPASPEQEAVPMRSIGFATLYGVRLTSLGAYRIYAYLSIPTAPGPHPAIYYVPTYASVHNPLPQGAPNELRRRYVTLSVAARGQRNSDRPYAAMFPGYLTGSIDDPSRYVFRGVAADSVRGLEYLTARSEVDASRVVLSGNDLALITAALGKGATHVVCAPSLFYDTVTLASRTSSYPLEEVNDYLRMFPSRRDAVVDTLDRFDLRRFAPSVNSRTLLLAGAPGSLLDGGALAPLAQALEGDVRVYESESSSYKDGLFLERWLTGEMGFSDPILPEAWR